MSIYPHVAVSRQNSPDLGGKLSHHVHIFHAVVQYLHPIAPDCTEGANLHQA
jgi:hypothetical protein